MGFLSRNYTHLVGTLAMTNCFLRLKETLSTTRHENHFLQQNLSVQQYLPKTFMVLQVGFVISDIVFGCENPPSNPSPVRDLSLLIQFSSITTL